MITTAGTLLMQDAVPPRFHKYLEGGLDGNKIKEMFTAIAKEQPDAYSDTASKFNKVAAHVASHYGAESSIGLADLKLPPNIAALRSQARRELQSIIENPALPSPEKNKRIVSLMQRYADEVPNKLLDEALKSNNAMALQAKVKARGNAVQLMQLLFGDSLLLDANNKPIPIAGVHGYAEGVTPLEYWASANGSRKGTIDVQFATANSGYLSNQLTNASHRVVVTTPDCGTFNGYKANGSDPDNVGSVLARDAGPFKAGTLVTEDMLSKLEDTPVYLRSTIACEAEEGVCAKCSGLRETGKFPEVGDLVGNVSSRAITEPITQLSLRSKHMGGASEKANKAISGFEEFNQFFQMPENFKGGATVSEADGRVTAITRPSTGLGWNVTVGNTTHYIPEGRDVVVKIGDDITAGDSLTTGTPNPADIVKYKGIGEGRRYFTDQFSSLLKSSGAAVHRRNVEALARGFINRVRITHPEGYNGYLPDDIVPYDSFVKTYIPREGSKEVPLSGTTKGYLEKPALHYTVGTRVTPSVIKDLSAAGVSSILIHDKEPVFQPLAVKARDFLESDDDWMVRLGGENLRRATMDAVMHGMSTNPKGTSYIATVANPVNINTEQKYNNTSNEVNVNA